MTATQGNGKPRIRAEGKNLVVQLKPAPAAAMKEVLEMVPIDGLILAGDELSIVAISAELIWSQLDKEIPADMQQVKSRVKAIIDNIIIYRVFFPEVY